MRRDFQAFLADLRQALHQELQEADVVSMIAQHLVTGPVFQALFADYDFVGSNPRIPCAEPAGGAAGSRGAGERDAESGALL